MKQKNIYVQVMRFLFSLMIVLFHMLGIEGLEDKYHIAGGGYKWLEFFGIVSGFLMCSGISVLVDDDVIKTSSKFFIHKIYRIFPMYLISSVFAITVRQICLGEIGVLSGIKDIVNHLPEVFLLQSFGLNNFCGYYNGATWYLDAMLLVMYLLYPLLLKYYKGVSYISFPLSLAIIGSLIQYKGGIAVTNTSVSQWLLLGNFRIMADILMGIFVYNVYASLLQFRFGFKIKLVGIICSVLLYMYIFYFAWIDFEPKAGGVMLIIIALGILLSFTFGNFSYKGRMCKALNILGEFSFPLYLNHRYWCWYINGMHREWGSVQKIWFYWAASFISAFICQTICQYSMKYLKDHIQKKYTVAQ